MAPLLDDSRTYDTATANSTSSSAVRSRSVKSILLADEHAF
jgi:hypothetical protein